MSVQVAAAGGDGQWVRLAPMSLARQETGAAPIGDTVYVAVGLLGNFSATATVETYDIASGHWSNIPNMPQPRDHAGVASLGDRLYVPRPTRCLRGRCEWQRICRFR